MFLLNSRKSTRGDWNPCRMITIARVRRAGSLAICGLLILSTFLLAGPISRAGSLPSVMQTSHKEIPLPTPRSHYDKFKPGASGIPLLMDLLKEFNPDIQSVLVKFAKASGLQDIPTPELEADMKKLQSLAESAGIKD